MTSVAIHMSAPVLLKRWLFRDQRYLMRRRFGMPNPLSHEEAKSIWNFRHAEMAHLTGEGRLRCERALRSFATVHGLEKAA